MVMPTLWRSRLNRRQTWQCRLRRWTSPTMALLPFHLYHQLHNINVLWQVRLQVLHKLLVLSVHNFVANKNARVNMNANYDQRLCRLLLRKNAGHEASAHWLARTVSSHTLQLWLALLCKGPG